MDEEIKKIRKMPTAKDFLRGKSSLQRGYEKQELCLTWMLKWGWSTAEILTKRVGVKQNYAPMLLKHGLVKKINTPSGGWRAEVPTHFFTLSEKGHELALRSRMNFIKKATRFPDGKMHHDLLCQKVTLIAIQKKQISGYQSEFERDVPDKKGVKKFDVIWEEEFTKIKIGVEIELTMKYKNNMTEFAERIVQSIIEGEVNKVIIFSDNDAILKRYEIYVDKHIDDLIEDFGSKIYEVGEDGIVMSDEQGNDYIKVYKNKISYKKIQTYLTQ